MTFKYFIKRLVYTIPILFGVTLFCFLIFNVVGGDPALESAGKNTTTEELASIRHELGLDRPLHKQYFFFLRQVVTLDWGQSWQTNESINQLLIDGLGPSLSLTFPPFLMTFIICLLLSFFTLCFGRGWLDSFLTAFCLVLMSVSFLVYIIVYQYFFAFSLNLFPINGWDESLLFRWKYLLLPWLISITVLLGPIFLICRSVFLEEALKPYIITAKAKGLSQSKIFFRHILKNSMIPLSTLFISQIPFLMTGSLLLESFFGIPGLGGLLMQAIQSGDFPVI